MMYMYVVTQGAHLAPKVLFSETLLKKKNVKFKTVKNS